MILSLAQSVDILKKGGVVCFPTETVYGLGAVATNKASVDLVYNIKNRPRDNPLICHFCCLEQIEEYAKEISNLTKALIEHFSPGPLSYVINLPARSTLLPATCGLKSMVARIPNHQLSLELIRQTNIPIVGPSANTSGKFSGTDSEMVEADLAKKTAGILDGGMCKIGLESTIIDARDNLTIKILRQGIIGKTELESFLVQNNNFKNVQVLTTQEQKNFKRVIPGNKYRHYAPKTPIIKLDSKAQLPTQKNIAVLAQNSDITQTISHTGLKIINLGENYEQIAKELYRNLFKLDQMKVQVGYLIWPTFDNSSLAEAIKEKLNRILEEKT